MPNNDNVIDALKQAQHNEERLAEEAAQRQDTLNYHKHAAAERAFKRAIAIVRQYV